MFLTSLTSVVLAQTLPEGSLGGAFVVRETDTELELALRFDQEEVADAPSLPDEQSALTRFRALVKVAAAVTIFDGQGAVVSVGKPRFVFRFSCENDGGRRAQTEARVTVKKTALPRPLVPHPLADGVAAIAVVGKVKTLPPLEPRPGAFISADVDRDGKVDVRLTGSQDEAMNCGEKKGKQWSVDLETATMHRALRCCGP